MSDASPAIIWMLNDQTGDYHCTCSRCGYEWQAEAQERHCPQCCEGPEMAFDPQACYRYEDPRPQSGPLAAFDAALALGAVTSERGATYGHPAENYRRQAALLDVVAECKDPVLRNILVMLCTKIARLIQTPTHLDSWIDVAGYARCAAMVLEDRDGD